ncbi:helix-turn-helix domain-containing protein, partial [Pseudomonas sp. AB12(2023)]
IDAGLELARSGGPSAVVLREATRRAGVTPNAAYRHFADRSALLEAVCSECQSGVARAIEDGQAALPAPPAASAAPAIAQADAAPAPAPALTA